MSDDIYARVENVFRGVLDEQQFGTFHREASMDSVEGWDSLNFLEVIMALESEFGIRIDGLDAGNMTSVPNIIEYLESNA